LGTHRRHTELFACSNTMHYCSILILYFNFCTNCVRPRRRWKDNMKIDLEDEGDLTHPIFLEHSSVSPPGLLAEHLHVCISHLSQTCYAAIINVARSTPCDAPQYEIFSSRSGPPPPPVPGPVPTIACLQASLALRLLQLGFCSVRLAGKITYVRSELLEMWGGMSFRRTVVPPSSGWRGKRNSRD
jgi:hypothetical protein